MIGNQGGNDAEAQAHNNVMGQMQQIGISSEHFQDVQGINKYLQDHRINQLFNVSITKNHLPSYSPHLSSYIYPNPLKL